jgi:hypothetical protein
LFAALASAACAAGAREPGVPPAASPPGRYALVAIDGDPLPADIRLPFPKLEPALTVRRGELEILGVDSAELALRFHHERCVAPPPGAPASDCAQVRRGSQQSHRLGYGRAGEGVVLAWPPWPSGAADSAFGLLRGDTLRLDIPFHQVHWITKRDSIWTQEFLFVRR